MAITKVTTDGIDMSGNTGGLTWVKGTTAQRTTTNLGDLRANTETNRVEIYTDQTGTSEWRNLKEESTSEFLEYLIVGGGGAGGAGSSGSGGGGGAGGYRTSTSFSFTTGTAYTIEVGVGGSPAGIFASGGSGGDSKFGVVGSEIKQHRRS